MENEKKVFPKLGSGTGLYSIAAHYLGAIATATDMNKVPVQSFLSLQIMQEAVQAILRRNLAANDAAAVQVVPHDWGTAPAAPLSPPYDYVLAADVIFKVHCSLRCFFFFVCLIRSLLKAAFRRKSLYHC